MLTEELVHQLKYLNQFLADEHRIRYIGFDMSRGSKRYDVLPLVCVVLSFVYIINVIENRKNNDVLERLASIADHCIKRTAFFHSGPQLHCNSVRPHKRYKMTVAGNYKYQQLEKYCNS